MSYSFCRDTQLVLNFANCTTRITKVGTYISIEHALHFLLSTADTVKHTRTHPHAHTLQVNRGRKGAADKAYPFSTCSIKEAESAETAAEQEPDQKKDSDQKKEADLKKEALQLTLFCGVREPYSKTFCFKTMEDKEEFSKVLRAGVVLGKVAASSFAANITQANATPVKFQEYAKKLAQEHLVATGHLLPDLKKSPWLVGETVTNSAVYACRVRVGGLAESENAGAETPSSKPSKPSFFKGMSKPKKAEPEEEEGLSLQELVDASKTDEEFLSRGTVFLTNYCIRYKEYTRGVVREDSDPANGSCVVPLTAIKKVERVKHQVRIHCKDYRIVVLGFDQRKSWLQTFVTQVVAAAFPQDQTKLFAFEHALPEHWENGTPYGGMADGWELADPTAEYQRLHMFGNPAFRAVDNKNFKLSPTYPASFMIPASITDEELAVICAYRSKARVPVATWQHPFTKAPLTRCSQPMSGISSKQSSEDARMLSAYRMMALNTDIMTIIDARPYKAAAGNKMMGKGFEKMSHYEKCRIRFMNIDNIHAIRHSLEKVVDLCASTSTAKGGESYWLSQLETSKWLYYSRLLLEAASHMALLLEDDGSAVVVHCSDGWDRTPQLSALCQLLLDPYFRTLEGFATLIEKEWTAMGHKFAERHGHGDADYTNTQRAPIFVQFLDAVWQLTRQFPLSFEFNAQFLLDIHDYSINCQFGTFLFETAGERQRAGLSKKTISVWTYMLRPGVRTRYTNALFVPVSWPAPSSSSSSTSCAMPAESLVAGSPRRLIPDCSPTRVVLWELLFLRWRWDANHRHSLPMHNGSADDKIMQLALRIRALEAQLNGDDVAADGSESSGHAQKARRSSAGASMRAHASAPLPTSASEHYATLPRPLQEY